MPDLTRLFENAFNKHDHITKSGDDVNTKITPENNSLVIAHEDSLHPEKIGKKRREEKLKAQKAKEDFINTITEDEYNNLRILSNDRLLIAKAQIIEMAEDGEDLDVDRLEKAGCIKRAVVEDLIEFRITGDGRRILAELNKRMDK